MPAAGRRRRELVEQSADRRHRAVRYRMRSTSVPSSRAAAPAARRARNTAPRIVMPRPSSDRQRRRADGRISLAYPVQVRWRSTVSRARRPSPAASRGRRERSCTACSRRSQIAGRHETTVHAVVEVVAARDRRSAGDDHRLSACHRPGAGSWSLPSTCCRERAARRPARGARHSRTRANGTSTSRRMFAAALEPPGVVGRRDDAKRTARAGAARARQELEVPARIRADRDDVVLDGRTAASGRKRSVSTPNATNSTRGPSGPSQARSSSTSPQPYATIVWSRRNAAANSRRAARPQQLRGAREDRSRRTRPAASRDRADRAAPAGSRPCRRSRTRRRSGSARRAMREHERSRPSSRPRAARLDRGRAPRPAHGGRPRTRARGRGRTSKPARTSSSSPYRL